METTYKNERLKREFYKWLENSKQFSGETIKCYEKAIWLWEDFTNKNDFGSFNETTATAFREWIKNKQKNNSQEKISIAYCYHNLRFLKVFFGWLSKRAGYKLKIKEPAIDCLNLSKNEVREAKQTKSVKNPTLDEIKMVIETIKGKTEIEKRDKAIFSLAFLTGARISAIRTLPMQSFDKKEQVIYQDPALGVETKYNKKITSILIPFGYKEAMDYFIEWFDYLKDQKGFKPEDPIFPATKIENGKENINYYNTGEVENKKLKSSGSLRKIFKKRFEQAGLNYYHPHTFRHWLVRRMAEFPLTEEQKKAFSQCLGHESTLITFGSQGYGRIDENRQIDIMKSIDFEALKGGTGQRISDEDVSRIAKQVSENIKNNT
ncbi:MAG: site-specific integrase [Patescibacteria group bacterium]